MAYCIKNKLLAQEERFSQEYVIDNNGTQAAIRAKYTPHSAKETASKLLARPRVQKRVAELQAEIADRLGIKADAVITEFARIAFANLQDFVGKGNRIKDVSKLPRELAAVIEAVDKGRNGTKIKLHSKLTALENLGKHLGIYEKDNSQKEIRFIVQKY